MLYVPNSNEDKLINLVSALISDITLSLERRIERKSIIKQTKGIQEKSIFARIPDDNQYSRRNINTHLRDHIK